MAGGRDKRRHRWSFAAGLIACCLAPGAARACPIEDLETPVEQLAGRAGKAGPAEVSAYEEHIIAPNAALFAPSVIGPFEPVAMKEAIRRSLAGARDPERRRTMRQVELALAAAMRRFSASFPDFRCNFPIYFMDSLGRFDGAGRVVGGRPALVLGIDQINAERKFLPLPLFLAHELFHRYHSAASGFSDDPGEDQAMWRALWAEGLATYVSYRLTPGASVDQALIAPPRLAQQAQPRVPDIARDLLAHLERTDPATYRLYFTYGNKAAVERKLPWRSGYYVGFLVARDLGRHRSLAALARLKGRALERLIAQSLARLASAGASHSARRG